MNISSADTPTLPSPMRCIGIDIAWGRTNTSGAVTLERAANGVYTVTDSADALTDDASLLAFIARADHGGSVVVALDGPTRVPNLTGRRPCEAECQVLFGRYQAGPHPANRTLLKNDIRGERLVAALEPQGFVHDPYFPDLPLPEASRDGTPLRRVIEVFPHPAHVVLFGLTKTLKYKNKPGRSFEDREREFGRYADFLRGLAVADPPLLVPEDLLAFPTGANGPRLKRYEDFLDALTCAYVAAYYVRWGQARVLVLGDCGTGHIVVPKRPTANEETTD